MELPKKVEVDSTLTDVTGSVNTFRRTQKGDLMFELKRSNVQQMNGEITSVRTRKHQIYIQCKDFDEVTSRGEIYTVLEKQFMLEEPYANECNGNSTCLPRVGKEGWDSRHIAGSG